MRFPVDATVVHDVNGQHLEKTEFFVRVGNGTKALDDTERQKYVAQHWPSAPG
ncbi:MAG: hypothetical protein M3Q72_05970 [Actinomycetota bacterium]|nr:hypothetical protein [Actinomycetota bacterium]